MTAYVLSQLRKRKERVTHVERVATRRLHGERYDIWDVRTKRSGRFWVMEPLTNLYRQRDHPSMDQTFSLHLGVMEQMIAKEWPSRPTVEQSRIAVAWRRWSDAAAALAEADEPEDFQTVGLRLREALIAMVKALAQRDMVPGGEAAPKGADVIVWSALIADSIAGGGSLERLRSHLKDTASSTWQLVSWLTHAQGATRVEADIALSSVREVLGVYGMVMVRHELRAPDRCPECGSYRLYVRGDHPNGAAILCEACGWEERPADETTP